MGTIEKGFIADKRPDCICWCQVRPVACALRCCGCIVHDDHAEKITTGKLEHGPNR
jgi:hypothetical protein